MFAHGREIDEPVDRSHQVIHRNVLLQTEAVEQRFLHHRPLAHHRHFSRFTDKSESGRPHTCKGEFFNTIDPKRTLATSASHRILPDAPGSGSPSDISLLALSCMRCARGASFKLID